VGVGNSNLQAESRSESIRLVLVGGSDGRRPLGADLHSSYDPGELSCDDTTRQHHKHCPFGIIIRPIITKWLHVGYKLV